MAFNRSLFHGPNLFSAAEIVDMTQDDDHEIPAGVLQILSRYSTNSTHTANRNNVRSSNSRMSSENVIDLVSDDEEPTQRRSTSISAPSRPPATTTTKSSTSPPTKRVKLSEVVIKDEFPPKKFGEADVGDEIVEISVSSVEGIPLVDNSQEGEIEFVGGNFQVASDMPHQREACSRFPFKQISSIQNIKFCPNCYCYVCEVKASECRSWNEHSNASCKDIVWKKKRDTLKSPLALLLSSDAKANAISIVLKLDNNYDDEEDDEEEDVFDFGYGRRRGWHDDYDPYDDDEDDDDDSMGYNERNSHNTRASIREEILNIDTSLRQARTTNTSLSNDDLVKNFFILLSLFKRCIDPSDSIYSTAFKLLVELCFGNIIDSELKSALFSDISNINREIQYSPYHNITTSRFSFIKAIITLKSNNQYPSDNDYLKLLNQSPNALLASDRLVVYNGLARAGRADLVFDALLKENQTTFAGQEIELLFCCLNEFYVQKLVFFEKFNAVLKIVMSSSVFSKSGASSYVMSNVPDFIVESLDSHLVVLLFTALNGRCAKFDSLCFNKLTLAFGNCSISDVTQSIDLVPLYDTLNVDMKSAWLSKIDVYNITENHWRALYFKQVLSIKQISDSSNSVYSTEPSNFGYFKNLNCYVNLVPVRTLLVLFSTNSSYAGTAKWLFEKYYINSLLRAESAERIKYFRELPSQLLASWKMPDQNCFLLNNNFLCESTCTNLLHALFGLDNHYDILFSVMELTWNCVFNSATSSLQNRFLSNSTFYDVLASLKKATTMIVVNTENSYRFRKDILNEISASAAFEACICGLVCYEFKYSSRNSVLENEIKYIENLKSLKSSICSPFQSLETTTSSNSIDLSSLQNMVDLEQLLEFWRKVVSDCTLSFSKPAKNTCYVILEEWSSILAGKDFIEGMVNIRVEDIQPRNFSRVMTLIGNSLPTVESNVLNTLLLKNPQSILSELGKQYNETLAKTAVNSFIIPIAYNIFKATKDNYAQRESMTLLFKERIADINENNTDERVYLKAIEMAAMFGLINTAVDLIKKKYSPEAQRKLALENSTIHPSVKNACLQQSRYLLLNYGSTTKAIPRPLLESLIKYNSVNNPIIPAIMPWLSDCIFNRNLLSEECFFLTAVKNFVANPIRFDEEAYVSASDDSNVLNALNMSAKELHFNLCTDLSNLQELLSLISPLNISKSISISFWMITSYVLKFIPILEIIRMASIYFTDEGVNELFKFILLWDSESVNASTISAMYEAIVESNNLTSRLCIRINVLKLVLTQKEIPVRVRSLITAAAAIISPLSQENACEFPLCFQGYTEFHEIATSKPSTYTFIADVYIQDGKDQISQRNMLVNCNISGQDYLSLSDLIGSLNQNQLAYLSSKSYLKNINLSIARTLIDYKNPENCSKCIDSLFKDDIHGFLEICYDDISNLNGGYENILNILSILTSALTSVNLFIRASYDLGQFNKDVSSFCLLPNGPFQKMVEILIRIQFLISYPDDSRQIEEIRHKYLVLKAKLIEISKHNSIVCSIIATIDSNFKQESMVNLIRAQNYHFSQNASTQQFNILSTFIAVLISLSKTTDGLPFVYLNSILKSIIHLKREKLVSDLEWASNPEGILEFLLFILERKICVTDPVKVVYDNGLLNIYEFDNNVRERILKMWGVLFCDESLIMAAFEQIIFNCLSNVKLYKTSRSGLPPIDICVKALLPSLAAFNAKDHSFSYIEYLINYCNGISKNEGLSASILSARALNHSVIFVKIYLSIETNLWSTIGYRLNIERLLSAIDSFIELSGISCGQEIITEIQNFFTANSNKIQHDSLRIALCNAVRSNKSQSLFKSLSKIPFIIDLMTKHLSSVITPEGDRINSEHRYRENYRADFSFIWLILAKENRDLFFQKFEDMVCVSVEHFMSTRLSNHMKMSLERYMQFIRPIFISNNEHGKWQALIGKLCKITKKKKGAETIIKLCL